MEKFDKAGLTKMRYEMQKALEVVAVRFGVELKIGSCSFSEQECTWQVKGVAGDEEKLLRDKFATNCNRFPLSNLGFKPHHFGVVFEVKGRGKVRLTGLHTDRPTNPISGEVVSDGTQLKMNKAWAAEILRQVGT